MEHLFIYPVLLFVTYLLYKVLKMKAGRNWLRKGGALPPMQTDMRKSVRDTTYMETVFPAEFKEHPDDADFFPDFAKMDIPENCHIGTGCHACTLPAYCRQMAVSLYFLFSWLSFRFFLLTQ